MSHRLHDPPSGFETIEVGSTLAWVRPHAREWVRGALERSGSLYAEAQAAAGSQATLHGRAPLFEVSTDAVPWLVRHYVRGGSLAPMLGDRYVHLGQPRPLAEAAASARLHEIGIPTPRVVAGAVYPAGLFYRGDLMTERLRGARDLGEILFGNPDRASPEVRVAALASAGALVSSLAAAGVRHADLNVKNFLVDVSSDPPTVHVLDLDRCRFGRSSRAAAGSMRRRLLGSLLSWERETGRPISPRERDALELGFERGTAPGDTAPR